MANQSRQLLQEREDLEKYRGVYVSMEELVAIQSRHCTLDLRGRRKALTAIAGSHHSSFRGRGIDFDEVRIYEPGDDVRNIDWRVTARTGKPHTKLFREERERPIYIVVDQGQSMFFGSQEAFKSVVAAKAAGYLAWGSREHGDRVGGFIFNDNEVQEIRPKEGKKGIQQYLRLLIQFNQKLTAEGIASGKRSAFINALEGVKRVIRPGSLAFVISDFKHFDDITLQHFSLVARHSDIVCIQVYDPLEQQLPPPGSYSFTNGQRAVTVNTHSKDLRKHYRLRFLEHQDRIRQQLASIAIPLIEISTADSVADVLNSSLGMKARSRK
ncbi:MAG: DUF58 domain-containing protein [Ketobacteraceae bacterium]|nr:DUF58 domain-containing protein [Ketobacteraceae bacterium]